MKAGKSVQIIEAWRRGATARHRDESFDLSVALLLVLVAFLISRKVRR